MYRVLSPERATLGLTLGWSAALDHEHLNAFCRERGIFLHHLDDWRHAFINSYPSSNSKSNNALRLELTQIKKELNRKEKARAETAALLVLQKSTQRSWRNRHDDHFPRTPTITDVF